MKVIKTEEAIGKVIAHDITEIVPGVFKGIGFKKGHIIQPGDVEKLLRLGKEHIYVFELDEDNIHEDDAAIALGNKICGEGVYFEEPPKEGKINILAQRKGYLKINKEILDEVNDFGDVSIATIHGNRIVTAGEKLAGCRIIPLTIKKEKLDKMLNIISQPIIEVKALKSKDAAIITTGSEVYKGRITDKFTPVIKEKLRLYDSRAIFEKIVPDDTTIIRDSILEAKAKGAQLIVVTGGMSVDPDDKTPGGIKATGAEIISYGSPVLPGSMILLAYLDEIPIFGLPGCVMYNKTTAFDLLLPKVFIDEKIKRKDITSLGYGGLCLNCDICVFPNCSFAKG
ncbi:molybdopterin-binding protein [Anaerobranca gottschalkii]|uniref:Molybdopterin molybdenumtransferase n=1 Tax=Anaerobranca gottschalkii DSM 13577 TaxID=1120990 RepID=A0A1H9YQ75_9FIRM|nr:molybdopterin-binding protein [Anaerobranca gottschalkii]SES71296.1 Probable molybdopterin binding domain-containing protein [Anaerobranca gottschalkii DSM 13577]